jgi:hypothetical protein
MGFSEATIERFWSKVDKRGTDDCWSWKAHINHHGYGWFNLYKQKPINASRVALMLTTNQIPDKTVFALHSCDNKACCNPNHLRWGTAKENNKDMRERHPTFLQNYKRRFAEMSNITNEKARMTRRRYTKEQIIEIKTMFNNGYGVRKIGKIMGIRSQAISDITRGKTYKEIVVGGI